MSRASAACLASIEAPASVCEIDPGDRLLLGRQADGEAAAGARNSWLA
jgi:hypothetical protein